MASARTFTLPHYERYPVYIALFKNVTNAGYLRSQLLEANPDFDYAFLDAEMIFTPSHLLTATFLALHSILTNRHKTRTPHSELVFRLSPNNNIGESYKRFGISDSTSTLIAVKLPLLCAESEWVLNERITNESVGQHLGDVVEGTSVEIDGEGEVLGQWCDVERVRKVYKLGAGDAGKKEKVVNGDKGGGDERKVMESIIMGTMALKGS